METKEVKELIVDVCKSVIEKISKQENVAMDELNIRVDLETIKGKPVFGLFNGSVFLGKKTIREIIKAGGGKGFNLILSTYISRIIRDIFSQTMKQLKIADSKEMFVLLYLKKQNNDLHPMLAVYHKKEYIWSMLIGEAIEPAP